MLLSRQQMKKYQPLIITLETEQEEKILHLIAGFNVSVGLTLKDEAQRVGLTADDIVDFLGAIYNQLYRCEKVIP